MPTHSSTNITTPLTISIIGGGPAAMMLAATLDPNQYNVHIYEKNKTLGRKFLVAGKGGFNLTHAEDLSLLITRYNPTDLLKECLTAFSNEDLRKWLEAIGIPTYIGSSKRIFPLKDIKPIEVLNKILEHLKQKGVTIHTSHTWLGWDKEKRIDPQSNLKSKHQLVFDNDLKVVSDIVVLAMGGGSWKVTGSDGQWCRALEKQGIRVEPLRAANCGFQVQWPTEFKNKYSGQPLKNIAITFEGLTATGEAMITDFGIEGNAIYALSAEIMKSLDNEKSATIYLDLKPTLTPERLTEKYQKYKKPNPTAILKDSLNLNKTHIALLKATLNKDTYLNPKALLQNIKALPISLYSAAPIDEAISTTGGISLEELDNNFRITKIAQPTYVIGEMVDWFAPTGGYLLQGCFSMGQWVGEWLNKK